jgi:hypothetical protein
MQNGSNVRQEQVGLCMLLILQSVMQSHERLSVETVVRDGNCQNFHAKLSKNI